MESLPDADDVTNGAKNDQNSQKDEFVNSVVCSSPATDLSDSFVSEESKKDELQTSAAHPKPTTNLSDDFVSEKLTEWDLPEYIDVFKREKISKFVFLRMPEEKLIDIIQPFGDRYQFILQREKYLELESAKSKENPPQTPYTAGSQLKKRLKSTFKGQYILKQGNLLECGNELATVVIDHILSVSQQLKITKKQYQFWAEEIVATWPKENIKTWYNPRNGTSSTSGKLYNRFCNQSRKVKKSVVKFLQEEKEETVGLQRTENEKIASTFIVQLAQTSLDDEQRILFLWEKSHKYRTENIDAISSYFENFFQLKTPLVKKLLELDFKLTYPKVDTLSLEKKWPNLHLKVIQLAKRSKKSNEILTEYEDAPSDVVAWKVFARLFAPVSMGTGIKKPWRASRNEQANGFITWIDVIDQMETVITERRNTCNKWKVSLQPFVIAVGPLKKLTAIYVVIDQERIKCNTITEAVAFCWKATFALNAKYQTCCTVVWLYIQKTIYELKLEDTDEEYQSLDRTTKALEEISEVVNSASDVSDVDDEH